MMNNFTTEFQLVLDLLQELGFNHKTVLSVTANTEGLDVITREVVDFTPTRTVHHFPRFEYAVEED